MPGDQRFITRAYQPGDEAAIHDLFARCFHAPRTIEHFRWKYLQNPYGNAHISLTFDSDRRLVGHYAGYPVPYVESGRAFIAHQIGDTMTERSVRHVGRGPTSVLGRTALHFYENFCESQVAFNYGFNVANIQKFSLQFLRSDRVEPVPYRVRDLRRDPIPRIGRLGRWPRGYQLEQVHGAGEEFDAFFARVVLGDEPVRVEERAEAGPVQQGQAISVAQRAERRDHADPQARLLPHRPQQGGCARIGHKVAGHRVALAQRPADVEEDEAQR